MVSTIKTTLKHIYYYSIVLYFSAKQFGKIGLGSQVIYEDKKYLVNNAVKVDYYDLIGNNSSVEAPKKECKLAFSFNNYFHSVRFRYKFYMTNWYRIWVNGGIKPWIKQVNIW